MESTKVRELIQDQKLVSLNVDDTISDALGMLANRNILSAPVIDNKTQQGPQQKILGFVDYLDLLVFAIRQCTKILTDLSSGESRSLTTDDMWMIKKRTKDFKLSSIMDVLDLSKRNPYYAISGDMPLQQAITEYLTDLHRVAITDKNGNLIGILTQRDALKFLSSSPDYLKRFPEFTKAASNFKNKTTNVVSIPIDTKAYDAFMSMYDNGVSSLAVTDNNGKLCCAFSASDLKGLKEKDFSFLLKSIHDYIGEIRKLQGLDPHYVVSATLDTPMNEIMNKMIKSNVHRVFLVDNNNKPTGIIALTDILQGLAVATTVTKK